MNGSVALLLFLALILVAALHAAWSFGSTFPADNEKALARTVAGFRGIEAMPPRGVSLAVAVALALCSLWAFVMAGWQQSVFPSWMVTWGGIKLTLLFGVRGILGYTAWWRRMTPEQPFARLDRIWYSPFCVAIAAGFLVLTVGRLA